MHKNSIPKKIFRQFFTVFETPSLKPRCSAAIGKNTDLCYNHEMAQNQNTHWVLAMYDQIMGQIEPDLLTYQIPLLEKKYKNEKPEERAKRLEAYAKAFKIFDEAFKEMAGGIYAEVEQLKHAAQQVRTTAEKKQRSDEMRGAEEQLGSSSENP
jgi:hypothetical protein